MEQPSIRLFINIDGVDKSYIFWNGTESYFQKLRTAYQDIKIDKDSEYLYFGFFTLCAATLEYSLNFTLTDFCLNHFGHDNYRKYAEGYINLSFPKKLLMCPSIVSKGKFKFNDNNSHFKSLNELITLRNRILHNKEFLKEFDFIPLNDRKVRGTTEFEIPMEPNHIDTLTKESCLMFGDALGKFKSCFMTPALTNKLETNELLIEM